MWKIRWKNPWFLSTFVVPILTLLDIGISKILFVVAFSGSLSGEAYDVVYPWAVLLSRYSLLSLCAFPFVLLIVVVLLILQKINWLEGLIGVLVNAVVAWFSFYYVIFLLGA